MRIVMVGMVFLVFGAAHLVASDPGLALATADANSASGQGSIRFGKDGHGVGAFEFEVGRGRGSTGSLLFACEGHHSYPDFIVRMDNIEGAAFEGRSASFSGEGKLHDDAVSVSVSVFDGKGAGQPDTFSIECTNGQGAIVFKARGEVFNGNVHVGKTR